MQTSHNQPRLKPSTKSKEAQLILELDTFFYSKLIKNILFDNKLYCIVISLSRLLIITNLTNQKNLINFKEFMK